MQKTDWKVDGMTCSNCALSISRYLQKKGMDDVNVNPITGAVSFTNTRHTDTTPLKEGIHNLGFQVVNNDAEADGTGGHNHKHSAGAGLLGNNKKRFLFTLPFTLVLMLHMLHGWLPLHWLMNPWIQLGLCVPVFLVGMRYFGKSAVSSLLNGIPNMDVLIALGSLAAFVYSLTGAILQMGEQYLFFETTASIITLVFMGNFLEEASVNSTQKAIRSLAKSQKVMANMIAYDDQHQEQIFPVDNSALKTGDLILIKNGEQVPADCKILWGECLVNEAIITGESLPVTKQKKDLLIGGSILANGTVKAQVTAAGKDTVLSGILKMVENAQSEKPPLQKLADKISAIFVPIVVGIAVLTFLLNYFVGDHSPGTSLMRSIAVLVISCPCAMGIATPAAIAVGLARAAKSGILFRNAGSLESFKTIRRVVFDKTGTLTTGDFVITSYQTDMDEVEFKRLVFSMEKFSNHPLAKAISKNWRTNNVIAWKKLDEIKGVGIIAADKEGNIYKAGSYKISGESAADSPHSIYILKNDVVVGWIDLQDEIRPEAKDLIKWLHSKQIETILLSGDTMEKCLEVAAVLNIDEVIAGQTPGQKLAKIAALNEQAPTAMIGDGINDAPALAKATLGISLSEASQIAMQSADVILLNNGLKNLPTALGLGKHTYLTIRQNLFWAFLYNVVALPVAAFGFLTPTVAALAMGLSDVVLAGNSARLFIKKVL